MKLDSLAELYVHGLKDLYNAEGQLIKALPKMAKAASNPALRQCLEEHLEETRSQRERLENLMSDLGVAPRGVVCHAMKGLIEEGQEVLDAEGDEATLDAALIAAGNKVEHYEIAAYGTARAHAELLGHSEHAEVLQTILDEETAADKKLTELSMQINRDAEEGGEGEGGEGGGERGGSRGGASGRGNGRVQVRARGSGAGSRGR